MVLGPTRIGFLGAASGKESACQCRGQEMPVRPLGQKDPLEKEMATTPVFLPWKFCGQRSLEGYGP